MPTNNDPSPESFDDSTLPTPKDLPSSHQADEFATVIPANGIDDATFVPPVDADATYVPVRNSSSLISVESRVRYFGDYELISEIARGGMGVVYKARQTNLNRVVALKMILAGQFASEEDVQRFRTEAEAAANLDHPGIVPIYEIGQHEGQHFFSMGYVDGCSLADRVRNGPLPPKEAAELTKKIAESIAFAHSGNVIHRDLKPANVLLDQNGEPKVTDFGLARKTDNDSGMTRTGAVMGTPSYMPPEQAAGNTSEVGPLSDVYSLGAILYCLLIGRPPFQAANVQETLKQVIEREPVGVSTINPEIQRDLETICHKSLQKEPSKRYASASELANDLGRWLRGEPIQARAVSNAERAYRWVRRNPVVSGLAIGVAMAISIGAFVSVWFGVQARQAELLATMHATQTEAILARSNYFLSLARWESNRTSDAVSLLEQIPVGHRYFEWGLTRLEFEGSDKTIYGHLGSVRNVRFSADGRWLVSSASGQLKVWHASSGKEWKSLEDAGHWLGSDSFDIHPSSRTIIQWGTVVDSTNPQSKNRLRVWDIETGQVYREFTTASSKMNSVSFSPDGGRFVTGSGDEVQVELKGVTRSERGEVKLWDAETGHVLRTIASLSDTPGRVSFSADGKKVIYDTAGKVLVHDASTGEILFSTPGGHSVMTPDGTGIYVCNGSQIQLIDFATSRELQTLDSHMEGVTCIAVSRDGSKIASGSSDKTVRVWDSAAGQLIFARKGHTESVQSIDFNHDGDRLVSGGDDKTVRYWSLNSDDNAKVLRGEHAGVHAISNDDQQIAICNPNAISIWNSRTGNRVRDLDSLDEIQRTGVSELVFSRTGTYIAACGGANLKIGNTPAGWLSIWDSSTGAVCRKVFSNAEDGYCVDFSRDGSRILMGGLKGELRIWSVSDGTLLRTLNIFDHGFVKARFNSDGTKLAAVAEYLKVIDHVSGAELWTATGGSCLCISEDGQMLATGSHDWSDGNIHIYSMDTGAQLRVLQAHRRQVSLLSFSPDGKRLFSVSDDGTSKLWDVATGEELRSFDSILRESMAYGPKGTISPRGTFLTTVSRSGFIKIRRAAGDSETTWPPEPLSR